jgi:hypothetical protein
LRVPPFVVTAMSSVPGDAARRAESMIDPVTVSELFGLITISFTSVSLPSKACDARAIVGGNRARHKRRQSPVTIVPVTRQDQPSDRACTTIVGLTFVNDHAT